jgi:hypothetical protein
MRAEAAVYARFPSPGKECSHDRDRGECRNWSEHRWHYLPTQPLKHRLIFRPVSKCFTCAGRTGSHCSCLVSPQSGCLADAQAKAESCQCQVRGVLEIPRPSSHHFASCCARGASGLQFSRLPEAGLLTFLRKAQRFLQLLHDLIDNWAGKCSLNHPQGAEHKIWLV